MGEELGRGVFGSLKSRVNRELHELACTNLTLRRARYSRWRRLLGICITNRPIGQLLLSYLILVVALMGLDWMLHHDVNARLPNYLEYFDAGFTKDLASYLIAGQIGILAIVSVAVGVVTLLSERTDGASVNTDIRLYYVESYAYEVAISGIALLLILIIQLFWPMHQLLHAWGVVNHDYWVKLSISAIHAVWFCVNLLLFLQFITTTLRFVEPNTRESLRERYTANEVIPRDARRRILRALYANAPTQIFGEKVLQDGPLVTFGYSFRGDEHTYSEIDVRFRLPSKLIDVRLRPLVWAIKQWQKRVRRKSPQKTQFGQPLWRDYLAILPSFDGSFEGQRTLVLRRGDVELSWLEKRVVRWSFQFGPATTRMENLPGPNDFLEQLIDKLISQIDQGAVTGFRAALNEVIRYHVFILATQSSKDDVGNAFNYAEVGGDFSRPDADWVRQYRRAFNAASDKIGSDTTFIDYLGHLASRLVPEDGQNFSKRVVETLLELGLYEVLALEDWLTRRAVISSSDGQSASPSLTGSDRRAYEDVLIGFVGSWESLLQYLIASYSIERHPNGTNVEQRWGKFSYALSVLQTHLHHSAYFFAVSIWNDDEQGADRYRDLLLRWQQPFYELLQSNYLFSKPLLLTPELSGKPWSTVKAEVIGWMRFGQDAIIPGPVFGQMLWEMRCDVVCISGLIALHWYATNPQHTRTAADAAVLTLRQVKRKADGSDLTATETKSSFRLLFDFVIRYALNPRFGEGSYSATIDELIRRLTELASPKMVSGRIYGGVGINGFNTLQTVILASLAANCPIMDDDGVNLLINDLKVDPLFDNDSTLRSFIWTIQQLVRNLDDVFDSEIYSKAAYLFNPELDLAAKTAKLKSILSNLLISFEMSRTERLCSSSLDEDRMKLVRHAMAQSMLKVGPGLSCFRSCKISSDLNGVISVMTGRFREIDKGLFTKPQMSALDFKEVPRIFVDAIRSQLGQPIWRDFYRRPKKIVSIDTSNDNDSFWQSAVREATNVGPDPMLLIPYQPLGEEVTHAKIYRHNLAGFAVEETPGMQSGRGMGYLGSVENIDIWIAPLPPDKAILCSGHLLQAIYYGPANRQGDIADFAFIDSENPEKSTIELKFAQRLEWSNDVFVEYTLRPRFKGGVAKSIHAKRLWRRRFGLRGSVRYPKPSHRSRI